MQFKLKDIEVIYHAAQEKGPGRERIEYLDSVCGENTTLRHHIEALLEADEQAGGFLEPPGLDTEADLDLPLTEQPGTVIGRYKLLEKIGEGGMAVVYMAEQQEPIRRKVALKIIKLGMDTKSVIARFEAERQALAMMDHPNIAKVLDAGATDTGRPYFVMELVKGASITDFCDINNLSTHERLALFVQVCQAVQHAHQKGIIHRDIKPTNVMVTLHDGVPVPKVIDFGIAKAVNRRLTEKTLFTRYAQMIGTPAYMSPEQAEMSGLDIDIRTDVFSLGTLLYELLTGSPPFESEYLLSKSYEEMQRIIREEEPTRPSTKISTLGEALLDVAKYRNTSPEALHKLIRNDLDWVVMKTLEKDRDRRYDTISEFAADIKRYLNNEPVLAGPPSTLYRIKKFTERRRGLFIAILCVVAALMIGLAATTMMFVRSEHSRRKESAARAEAQNIIDFLTNDLLASVYPEKAKSREVTVRYILETASKNLENKFINSPLAEAAIRETLGITYQKMGDYMAAEQHLERVLELRRQQLGKENPATLNAINNLGWLYWYQGRYDDAEPLLLEAMETRSRVLGEAHPDTLESMSNLGWLYGMRRIEGQVGKAMELHSKVLEIGANVLGEEHPVMLQSMCDLALEYTTLRQLGKAESLATKSLEISRRVLGNEHEATLYHMNTLAWVYSHEKRIDEAMALTLEALNTGKQVVGEDHLATVWAMNIVGWLYLRQGRYDEAMEPTTRSVEISRRLFGEGHALTQFFKIHLVYLYKSRKQYTELDELLIRSYKIGRQMHGEKHLHTSLFRQQLLARLLNLGLLAETQYHDGQYQDALATFTHIDNIRSVLRIESTPFELAFIAMSLWQMDQDENARATLNRLRQMCASGDHVNEEKPLYEAEQLIACEDETLHGAWDLLESGRLDEVHETISQLSETIEHDNDDNIQSLVKALARTYCVCAREAEARGKFAEALSAYETAFLVDSSHVPLLNRLARLLVTCPDGDVRDGSRAIQIATQACELTTWQNAQCIDALASAYAEAKDFEAAVKWQNSAIGFLPNDVRSNEKSDYVKRLHLYEANKSYHRKNALPMIAWWRFDKDANGKVIDHSGNGLDGRLIGDAEISVDLERGSVLSLQGNDYVDCGNDTAFDTTGSITVAAWIKVGVFDRGHQTVASKGDTAWWLRKHYGGNEMEFGCAGISVLGHKWNALRGTKAVNDAQWHHIVGVYDGMQMYLYLDGELDVAAKARGNLRTNDDPVFIGASSSTSGREWNGWIDDVRVYNYALSEREIKALYADQEPDTPRR